MTIGSWGTAAPAVAAAFAASLVEVVEAFTIVLAVASVRGVKPAAIGTVAGLVVLAALVLALGPALGHVPLHLLQFIVGLLLLLFGMRWLRKAILRAAGLLPLHDEEMAFSNERASLQADTQQRNAGADWIAGVTAFKAVLLEGVEVVFIVLAVGAGRGLLLPAGLGAAAAAALVMVVGIMMHRPLSRVPENTLKFVVGVMLSAFGIFWTGEGLGVAWPGGDGAVLVFGLLLLAVAAALVSRLRHRIPAGERR